MHREHRGHLIRLIPGHFWRAELVELATGALLPTSVMASAKEGAEVCAERAQALVDIYLDAQRKLRPAPARPPAPLRLVEAIRP